MKKILSILILSIFIITGCNNTNDVIANETNSVDTSKPVNLREINGPVVKAQLDDNGNIIIKEEDISNIATYISYDVDGVIVGLLAVRDSKGNVKVVVNTCQSCGGSPYAYFVQVDDKIQCQNCGNYFAIDELDNLVPDGCNPISIDEISYNDGIITIGVNQLKDLKDRFENWMGPKA